MAEKDYTVSDANIRGIENRYAWYMAQGDSGASALRKAVDIISRSSWTVRTMLRYNPKRVYKWNNAEAHEKFIAALVGMTGSREIVDDALRR